MPSLSSGTEEDKENLVQDQAQVSRRVRRAEEGRWWIK